MMVYYGVRWLYREGLSDGEEGTDLCMMVQMVYDGRNLSDGCLVVYDGV